MHGPVYVYGIYRNGTVPPATGLSANLVADLGVGIGDAPIAVVAAETLSALVSAPRHVPVPSSRRNLLAHTAVLERAMPTTTLLPVRFGTVAPSRRALIRCLDANAQPFGIALADIEGMIEIGLKATWRPKVVYDAIVDGDSTLRAMRDRMRQRPARDTYSERIELGRRVEAAMQARRAAEASDILATLQPLAARDVTLKVITEEMVVNHAFLVPREAEPSFDAAVASLGDRFGERMTFRYVAPVPPYNFVSLRADWLTARPA
jgi:hypothetical protein